MNHAPPKEATNIPKSHTLLSFVFGFRCRSTSCVLQSCTSRCVRRAFFGGFDALTGKDHEYRRQRVEYHIQLLGEVFCINVCAYAVMSNHHHLVLHINTAEAHSLTNLAVCER
jgi:hypothetical protein